MSIVANRGQNIVGNSVGPDEMYETYEPFHLALHCLQKHMSWSTGLKGLTARFSRQ